MTYPIHSNSWQCVDGEYQSSNPVKDLYIVLIMPVGEDRSIQRKDSETQYINESVYQ